MSVQSLIRAAIQDNKSPEEQAYYALHPGEEGKVVLITKTELVSLIQQAAGTEDQVAIAELIATAVNPTSAVRFTSSAQLFLAYLTASRAKPQYVVEPPAIRMEHWPVEVQKLIEAPSAATIKKCLDKIDQLAVLLPDTWNKPNNLQAERVVPTLTSSVRAYEAVSYLRLLAIATGKLTHPQFSSEQAGHFLSRVLELMPLHLDPASKESGKNLAYQLAIYTQKELSNFKYAKKEKEVRVASIQFDSGFCDTLPEVRLNIRNLAKLAEEAAQHGAQFIVTPEASVQGYADVSFKDLRDAASTDYNSLFFTNGVHRMWCHDSRTENCSSGNQKLVIRPQGTPVTMVDVTPVALPKDSKELQPFSDVAKKYKVYVAVGYIEKEAEGTTQKIYNSVNVYGPDGTIAYHYRKSKLWQAVDKYVFTEVPLPKKPYFDTPYGRFSAAICFAGNVIFPQLAPYGVDSLLYSVAWVSAGPADLSSLNHNMIAKKVLGDVDTEEHAHPMNVVMANWVWKDAPRILGDHAEPWGSGLSYIMDNQGNLRGMVTDNQGSAILYSTIPTK